MAEHPIPHAVTLRSVEPGDLDTLFRHQLDTEANEMAAFGAEDPADRAAFDRRWERILANRDGIVRAILADGALAGSILRWRDPDLEGPEVSYWLGREWWGRGIAGAALAAFLEITPERPVFGRVASANAASRRVLERAGFRLVRTETNVAASGGRIVDEHVLRLD